MFVAFHFIDVGSNAYDIAPGAVGQFKDQLARLSAVDGFRALTILPDEAQVAKRQR